MAQLPRVGSCEAPHPLMPRLAVATPVLVDLRDLAVFPVLHPSRSLLTVCNHKCLYVWVGEGPSAQWCVSSPSLPSLFCQWPGGAQAPNHGPAPLPSLLIPPSLPLASSSMFHPLPHLCSSIAGGWDSGLLRVPAPLHAAPLSLLLLVSLCASSAGNKGSMHSWPSLQPSLGSVCVHVYVCRHVRVHLAGEVVEKGWMLILKNVPRTHVKYAV